MEGMHQDRGKGREVAVGDGGGNSSTGASTWKLRGPIENPWSHGEKYKLNGWKCGYCPAKQESGGATRLRDHLVGLQGDGKTCSKVPRYVRDIMLRVHAAKKKRKMDSKEHRLFVEKAIMDEAYGDSRRANIPRDEAGQLEWALRKSMRDYRTSSSNTPGASNSTPPLGRSSSQSTMNRFFRSPSVSQAPFDIDLARSKTPTQLRVDNMLGGDAKVRLGTAISKWFQSDDIPGRKVDNPYCIAAIKLAQQLGEGVPIPTGREIDGTYLDMNYDDLMAHMEESKENWGEFGVTIMCDSWTGPTKMCIINFMIFCNGRMFFHKTVNATGRVQNSEFIYDCIKEVVIEEIGAEFVVQIVTDNGSNYKKACKQLTSEYKHITWQPCAAHTINLMLKDIARFPEVEEVVDSAKQICRFLYNRNRLHAMMKNKIGGELIRWNATRFGTIFLFLQSLMDKQEQFQSWMVSSDWKNNDWKDEEEHKFTYDCLTDRHWWENVEVVLKAVTPLYCVLRFADQQKNGTISGFIPKMLKAQSEIFANLKHDNRATKDLINRVNEVINRRTRYLLNDTLMLAAAALDPESLYRSNFLKHRSVQLAVTLAFKKLATSPIEASKAGDQYANYFCQKRLLFGSLEARSSALRGETSTAHWWNHYGGECKELQKLAKLIVSQCMSSSGCERNWNTFALVHSKVRNRLSYDKLHKLVYVHYNLKLTIQQFEADFQSRQQRDPDPCSMMMDLALFDEDNPMMDWLSNSRTESTPILDQYDDSDEDWCTPGGFLIDELQMQPEEVTAFKRKLGFGKKGGMKKGRLRLDEEEECSAEDYESDSSHDSPVYAESGDSSSASDENGDGVEEELGDGPGGGDSCAGVGEGLGDGASGSRARGGAARCSRVRIGKPSFIHPRSSRIKKPTLKSLSEL